MSLESTAAIADGLRGSAWTIEDLWRASLGMGGSFSPAQIDDIASGRREATPLEHDILAAALNDHFLVGGHDHPVRYWRELAR